MPRQRGATSVTKSVELDRSRTPFIIGGFVLVGLLISGGAIMWGKSDNGQIDVTAALMNSAGTIDPETGENIPQSAPAQVYVDLPNGGLQAQGGESVPPPAPPPPVETSTTTNATSTELGESDGGVSEVTDTEETTGEATTNTEATPDTTTTSVEGGGA